MKSLIFTALLLSYAVGIESCDPPVSLAPCESSLWAHTYGAKERFGDPSDRTKLYHQCVTVRGRVESVSLNHHDGDLTIKLRLFPTNFQPYTTFKRGDLLNSFNEQFCAGGRPCGRLVVEIVCATEISNPADPEKQKIVAACANYRYRGYRPVVGDSVSVTGELVTDTGVVKNPHWNPQDSNSPKFIPGHGWKEIHPVTTIRKLGP